MHINHMHITWNSLLKISSMKRSYLTLVYFIQTCWVSANISTPQKLLLRRPNKFLKWSKNGQPWSTVVNRGKQWSTVVQTVIYFHTLYQVNNK